MKKALFLLGLAFVITASAFAANIPKIKNVRVPDTDGANYNTGDRGQLIDSN
jgi:hypothetical protein